MLELTGTKFEHGREQELIIETYQPSRLGPTSFILFNYFDGVHRSRMNPPHLHLSPPHLKPPHHQFFTCHEQAFENLQGAETLLSMSFVKPRFS